MTARRSDTDSVSVTPARPRLIPGSHSQESLLSIRDLRIDTVSQPSVRLIDQIDLDILSDTRVALVGESGSGKSVLARSILRLDEDLSTTGSITFEGVDVLRMNRRDLVSLRGRRIGMVFQDPGDSLDPLQRVGDQVAEPLRAHGMSRRLAAGRARDMLDELGVPNAARRMRAYPHEFSGGMRQRVVMAMALIQDPTLLIADEPTTALDVRVQEQVFRILNQVSADRHLSVILITHDLAIVAGYAQYVAVMYAGRIVEYAPTEQFFSHPRHPYSKALLDSICRMDAPLGGRLAAIPGTPATPATRPAGCAFHPRCPVRIDLCSRITPGLTTTSPGAMAACHLLDQNGSTDEAATAEH